MFSKLALVATCATVVDAHVRGIYVSSSIRNAGGAEPQPTGDGRLSTNGPCGGEQTFGRNGINEVTAGTEVTLSMAYNGGHADPGNHFQLAIQCGGIGSDAEFKIKQGAGLQTTRPTKLASIPDLVQGNMQATATPVQLKFTMPPAEAGDKGDLCTVSMLDQRNWGACSDFKILPAGAPTVAPVVADLKNTDFSTTFLLNEDTCTKDSPDCACMMGKVKVSHVKGEKNANADIDLKDVSHKNNEITGIERIFSLEQENIYAYQMEGRVNVRKAEDGDPTENFEITVYYDEEGMTVSGTNTADAPMYCGFDLSQKATEANTGATTVASALLVFALAIFAA